MQEHKVSVRTTQPAVGATIMVVGIGGSTDIKRSSSSLRNFPSGLPAIALPQSWASVNESSDRPANETE
jgi:hypothetical protein